MLTPKPCIKCGSYDHSIVYRESRSSYGGPDECLSITCKRCGYYWKETPLDKREPEEDTEEKKLVEVLKAKSIILELQLNNLRIKILNLKQELKVKQEIIDKCAEAGLILSTPETDDGSLSFPTVEDVLGDNND